MKEFSEWKFCWQDLKTPIDVMQLRSKFDQVNERNDVVYGKIEEFEREKEDIEKRLREERRERELVAHSTHIFCSFLWFIIFSNSIHSATSSVSNREIISGGGIGPTAPEQDGSGDNAEGAVGGNRGTRRYELRRGNKSDYSGMA